MISFPRPVWYWSDWSSCLAAGSVGRRLAAEKHEVCVEEHTYGEAGGC